ncbi:MAG: DPP IV N-terminal domain-containing protein [bacterium]
MKNISPIACLLLASIALADAQVTVRKGAGQKSSIDLAAFAAAADQPAQILKQTLEGDLIRSGWFSKAAAGQGEFAVTGSSRTDGATVRAECTVAGRGTQRTYLSEAYKRDAADARKLAHQIADEIVEAVTGRKGMASGRLAMVGNRTGKKELYFCDADGRGLLQLTRDNNVSIGPNWSPDGRQLVYTSFLKGFPDVFLIELASGKRSRIANYPGLNTGAAFSPDGRDIALVLSKDGNPGLYIKSVASGSLTRLTVTKKAAAASPSWSPDGRRIVYVSDQSGQPQLYIIDRNGGQARRLTSRGYQNVAPDWGANGIIAYASLLGGRWGISIIDPATLDGRQVSPGDADYEDPSWAPDGRHIACGRAQQYKSRVSLLDTFPNPDPPFTLTDYPGDWYSPAWSPKK